jgi:hypothetical protein
MKLSDIRQLIATSLRDLGLGDAKSVGEPLLTKVGIYIGCRFDFEEASAIWLEEVGQVRICDYSGKLLKVIRLNEKRDGEVGNQAA